MHVAWLQDLRMKDLPQVGGKNASLGEMIGELSQTGIRVPGGFATTAEAYREFLRADGLDQRIARRRNAVVVSPRSSARASTYARRLWSSTQTCMNSQPARRLLFVRSPVMRCPTRRKRPSFLTSRCRSSPGR